MSATIEVGAMARVNRYGAGNLHHPGSVLAYGLTLTVEDFVSATEAHDGVPFYYGSANGGINNIAVRADCVELVKSKADMDARTVPTPAAIAEHIADTIHSGDDGFAVDETEQTGATVQVYGSTDDGLRFAAVVQVLSVVEVDF